MNWVLNNRVGFFFVWVIFTHICSCVWFDVLSIRESSANTVEGLCRDRSDQRDSVEIWVVQSSYQNKLGTNCVLSLNVTLLRRLYWMVLISIEDFSQTMYVPKRFKYWF